MVQPVNLLAVATAVPPHKLEQTAVADGARHVYARTFARYPKLADVFVNAGIERRYSVRPLEWFGEPHDLAERTQRLSRERERIVRAGGARRARSGAASPRATSMSSSRFPRPASRRPALKRASAAEMGFRPTRDARAGVRPRMRRRRVRACRSARGWRAPNRARSCSWSWSSCARWRSASIAAPRPT